MTIPPSRWTDPTFAALPASEQYAAIVRGVPIDPDDARELSRAAKQITAFTERRNALIVAIHAKGGGLREIGRIAGLTHRAVSKIIERHQR